MNRTVARELMDDPVESLAELEGNLRDIAFANTFFGGTAPVVRAVTEARAGSVLDVGCGSADIPLALVRAAEKRGVPMTVTCLDHSAQMLAIAEAATRNHPRLRFVRGEGESLPFADDSFDVVMCNLAMHHFEPAAAAKLLGELRRVARTTPIVCDLSRSSLAYALTWLYTRIFSRNRLTRHDGPLSVRRAYTPDEALALARGAGWNAPRVQRSAFFRMTLTDANV